MSATGPSVGGDALRERIRRETEYWHGHDRGCGADVGDLHVHVLAGSNSPKLGNAWIETEFGANRGESGTRDWAASQTHRRSKN